MGPTLLISAGFALAAKAFYSGASAEELRWIMGPTAWLVGAAFGETFEFEAGVGFVSLPLSFAIVPACAGVNFLIVAACSLASALAPAQPGWNGAFRLMAVCLAASYPLTIAANATRICAAIAGQAGGLEAALGAASLHRLEGTLIYLAFLAAAHGAAGRLMGARC